MKQWWEQRTTRERWVLAGGALLLGTVLFYAWLWQPLHMGVEQRRAALQARQDTLAWMRAATAEVPQLRARHSASGTERASASLLAMLESSAREAGLRERITRMEPEADNRVRLSLREVGFDQTVHWLATLQGNGISVRGAQFVSADRPGTVNASLTLGR